MSYATDLRTFKADLGQLLAQHQGRKASRDLTSYADDPISFIRDVLRGEPVGPQVEIAEAVRDAPLVAVRSCNGFGKDWISGQLALWWAYARRGLVLITGPTERQVKEVAMGEVRRAWNRARDLPGSLYELALRIDRDTETSGILAFTSSDASRLTGFHAPRLLVIITEAQGVEGLVWEGMLANATGEDSRLLAVGNPLEPIGKFYDVNRSPHWRVFPLSAFDHPNLREEREVVPGAVTAAFVERMRQEYGESSGVYQSRVLGEFPADSEEVLVRREWLESAADRFDRGELQSPNSSAHLALDPARYGADMTMLAVRRGGVLVELGGWRQKSTMESAGRLLDRMRQLGVPISSGLSLTHVPEPAVVIDEVGLGGGVVDRLREQGVPVDAFNGGRSPSGAESDRFLNRRAQSFWHLRQLLDRGVVAIPRDDALWEELLNTKWSITSSGKLQLESKDDIKARIGRSPDRADAVAMVYFNYGRHEVEQLPILSTSYWSVGGVTLPAHEVGGYF